MRAVFMGTPAAAVPALEVLHAHHEIASVYTQPHKPAGRGRRVQASPVEHAAERLGLAVHRPATLREPAEHDRLRALAPEVVVVVAYGKILPPQLLAVPTAGCVNVHFSVLPRWRGAAPVERAIMAGDTHTGVTTMLMDEGMDTGPVLLARTEPIATDDTAGSLTVRLAALGATLLTETLRRLGSGDLTPMAQPADGVTMAPKITPADAELDLGEPAVALERRVRALDPAPGAFTWLRDRRLKIWSCPVVPASGAPGTVSEITRTGPVVVTGEQGLLLTEVQPEGKARMSGADLARGYRLTVGARVGREAGR